MQWRRATMFFVATQHYDATPTHRTSEEQNNFGRNFSHHSFDNVD
jgi:hypothetical protein